MALPSSKVCTCRHLFKDHEKRDNVKGWRFACRLCTCELFRDAVRAAL